MPIYEYECVKCKNHTEILQKFSDPPLKKCELCNGKMNKLISQSTFHLKGSGWYVTDYGSKGKDYNNTSSSETTATDDKKLSTKGDEGKKETTSVKEQSTNKTSNEKKV